INAPLPAPRELFDAPSIAELPFIEYDRTFQEHSAWEWERHAYDASYAIRFLLSKFPRWSSLPESVTDDAMKAVNAALITTFVARARREGSTPIVVYFPGAS